MTAASASFHPFFPHRLCRLVVILVLLVSLTKSFAATKTWDGSSSGYWSAGANWSGGTAPVAGDDLVFPATGVTRFIVTNDFIASPRAFDSITFSGSNYVVWGTNLVLTNGLSSQNPTGTNTVHNNIDVRGSQFFQCLGATALLVINGAVALDDSTLTVNCGVGDIYLNGSISGVDGAVRKIGTGTLRYGGAFPNSYTGLTLVSAGVLELNKFFIFLNPPNPPFLMPVTSIAGDLTVGDGSPAPNSDVVRLLFNEQIANTSDVRVQSSGLLDLNGNIDTIGSLTMIGGRVDTDAGRLTLNGDLTSLTNANTALINGTLSLGTTSRTFNVAAGLLFPTPDLRINANIVDDAFGLQVAGIIKTGTGMLRLDGTNTFDGNLIVNEGELWVSDNRALGATTNAQNVAFTAVNNEATIYLDGVSVTNELLVLNSTNPNVVVQALGSVAWRGDIELHNHDMIFASASSFLIDGEIDGDAGIIKIGSGAMTFGGIKTNHYTGTTWVKDGTLLLNKSASDRAMQGPLVIGLNELPIATAVVRWLSCCQLPSDTDMTVNASGLADLNGFNESLDEVIFNGGDVDAPGSFGLTLLGDITVNRNTNSQSIITGRMDISSNPIINVTGHNYSPDLNIQAELYGSGGFTKNGPGEVGLYASNSFAGVVTVNQNFLLVFNSFALGLTNAGTVVNSGGSLSLLFGVAIPREPLTLAGAGLFGFGALNSLFGSNSWAGNITLTSNATIHVHPADEYLNLSGSITTNGRAWDITKNGTGTLIYSGGTANTYDDTVVTEGTLELAKTILNGAIPGDLQIGDGVGGVGADVVRITGANGQIASDTVINILSSGLFDLNTVFETIHGITGNGRIDLGTGILDLDNFDDDFVFNGLIFGAGNLRMDGNGTLTLTANNTYTGATIIGAGDGALIINGSQPLSTVIVGDDADLAGSGVVGHIECLGEIKPGQLGVSDPAILTCSNLFFGSSTIFHVDINGSAPGTGYDQLNVRGTNTLSGNSMGTSGTELRVKVGGGFAPVEGQQFMILNNDGGEAIVGTFDGLPNNSVFTAMTGERFHIRYSAIFENDVILTFTNPALRAVTNVVSGGNGNGVVNSNECVLLSVIVTNTAGNALSNVTGRLISKTPGITVTHSTVPFPVIPANGRATNTSAPFQFSTTPAFVCGTNIQFDLVLTTLSNGTFTVPVVVGATACGGNGGGGCECCPERIISGFLSTNSLVQSNRLFRDEEFHVCDEVRICPGTSGGMLARYFDVCTFENGESNACITVTLSTGGANLFSAAYTNSYNPADVCQNYLSDLGNSVDVAGASRSYSFNIGPRGRFAVVVHGITSADVGAYTLAVTGGSCRPVLKMEQLSANRVALDWSTAAIGYSLLQTNRLPLTPNLNWIPVTPAPMIFNSRYRVTNTMTPSNTFYELRKP